MNRTPYTITIRFMPDINSSANAHECAQQMFEHLLNLKVQAMPCSPVFSRIENQGTIYYAQIKCGFDHSKPLHSALNACCQPIIEAEFNICEVQVSNAASLNDIL